MIVLPPYQKSVMIGILLSDGHLSSSKTHENPHLTFKQKIPATFDLFTLYFLIIVMFILVCKKVLEKIKWILLYIRGLPCFKIFILYGQSKNSPWRYI